MIGEEASSTPRHWAMIMTDQSRLAREASTVLLHVAPDASTVHPGSPPVITTYIGKRTSQECPIMKCLRLLTVTESSSFLGSRLSQLVAKAVPPAIAQLPQAGVGVVGHRVLSFRHGKKSLIGRWSNSWEYETTLCKHIFYLELCLEQFRHVLFINQVGRLLNFIAMVVLVSLSIQSWIIWLPMFMNKMPGSSTRSRIES